MCRWACLFFLLLPTAALAAKHERGPSRIDLRLDLGAQHVSMKQWHDGIASLEDLARSRDLPILTSVNPGFGSQIYGTLLVRVAASTWVGATYGRITSKPRFSVLDSAGFVVEYAAYATDVDAYSLVGAIVVKHDLSAGQFKPHVEIAIGRGSGRVDFHSPGASVHGEGHAPIVTALVGADFGIAHLGIGVQYHRYTVTYGDPVFVATSPQPKRYWFTSEDEVRQFVASRNVDQTGVFARMGFDLRLFHEAP